MRQRYLFLILAVLTMVLGGCKKKPTPIVIIPDIEKNHLQRNHIFGYVKYLDTETYNLQGDSISLSDTANIQHLLKICEERCDVPDVSRSRQQYTSDGFLLHFTKFAHIGIAYHRDYTYADDARIERWQEFNPNQEDSLVTFGEYQYDRNRFLVGEKIYQGDSLVMSFTHTTDGVGNAIRTVQTFGKLQTVTENKFNEQGLVTQITEYEPDGKIFKTAKIEYDNYGDEVNRCVYKTGNQMIEYTYTQYDQTGRVRKVIYEDKLHHVKEHHYFFDYDSHKNWQTEVCAVDNQIVYVKRRTFEYYNE